MAKLLYMLGNSQIERRPASCKPTWLERASHTHTHTGTASHPAPSTHQRLQDCDKAAACNRGQMFCECSLLNGIKIRLMQLGLVELTVRITGAQRIGAIHDLLDAGICPVAASLNLFELCE